MPSPKPLIFISHINEEQELAKKLKDILEAVFLGQIEVFVSSDPRSNKAGRDWWLKIQAALKTCICEIILASPKAVGRPWVNFEAGAVWSRDVPVCPLCHSGMELGKLPAPLDKLTALMATTETDLNTLLNTISELIEAREPRVEWSEFIQLVRRFETDTATYAEMTEYDTKIAGDDLSEHEIRIVRILALKPLGEEGMSVSDILDELNTAGINGIAANLCIKMLLRKEFIQLQEVDHGGYNNSYFIVQLTQHAWDWLERHSKELDIWKLTPRPTKQAEYEYSPDDVPF